MRYDPQERQDKIDGLVERYKAGEFSTVVFTASLKAMRMRPDEIADLLCQNIFTHQASLPYRRGDFGGTMHPIDESAIRIVEGLK